MAVSNVLKRGSARVQKYDAEPMTLKVFQELSIHYIEPNAGKIPVSLVQTHASKKRKREKSKATKNEEN